MEPRYPDITVELLGFDSNAYSIIGKTAQALRRAGVSKDEINEYKKKATSGDYDDLLNVTENWVTVL